MIVYVYKSIQHSPVVVLIYYIGDLAIVWPIRFYD